MYKILSDDFKFFQIFQIFIQKGRGQGSCLKRVTWLDGLARLLFVPTFIAFVALFINQSAIVVPNKNMEEMSSYIPYVQEN